MMFLGRPTEDRTDAREAYPEMRQLGAKSLRVGPAVPETLPNDLGHSKTPSATIYTPTFRATVKKPRDNPLGGLSLGFLPVARKVGV